MLRRITAAVVVCGLAVLGTRFAAADDSAAPANDQDFVAKAAVGGSTEVALGKMALDRATDPEVKKFAQRMIADHTAANQELLTLAARKQMAVPRAIDAKHQQAVNDLGRLQGSEFDKAYMKQMVKDHEETVSLFKGESSRGQDADLKAVASKLLPRLEDHLKMARHLGDQVKNGANARKN